MAAEIANHNTDRLKKTDPNENTGDIGMKLVDDFSFTETDSIKSGLFSITDNDNDY